MKALFVLPAALMFVADDPPIERVRWMSGCWELSSGRRKIVEMWMPPSGGMMIGASRLIPWLPVSKV